MIKKFIFKSSLFVLPFLLMYGFNWAFYKYDQGDLLRMGNLYALGNYHDLLLNNLPSEIQYSHLSKIDLNKKVNVDLLTIGDSYSEQGGYGYQNILVDKGVSVLHVDRFVSKENPLQTLINLTNSQFFDIISPRYILLQSVERSVNQRTTNLSWNSQMNLDSLSLAIGTYQKKLPPKGPAFFSKALYRIPITNIRYVFEQKPPHSKTFKFQTIRSDLFSYGSSDLLILDEDVQQLDLKNDKNMIMNLVNQLTRLNDLLREKNITLLVLIGPDKYDCYYHYIANKSNYPEPQFFDVYNKTPKNYLDVDVYSALTKAIEKQPDVYFYDDTHWSPIGAEIVANSILESLD